MTAEPESMRLVNPDPAQPPLDDAARATIKALAAQQHAAGTVLMQVINFVGGQVEDGLKLLPGAQLARIESAASAALRQSYDLAGQSRRGAMAGLAASESGHRALAMISGALGGMGGLPTALAELPVATTVIFRSVQSVAEAHGEDPKSEETRLQCLQVFGAGGPGTGDDGIDTSFIGARLTLTGPALNKLLARIAPRFASVIGQKLAGQAVPVLGAAAGAGTNYAFMDYYTRIARVHFGLRKLARTHGEEAVLTAFHAELARLRRPAIRR
ncbi:EcsC family protein [Salibaculum sp.]|uniref:EcsC family protein n=1 Tax=Salibaculum sp. TaxID=2855480 RepID=UPI002B459E43|nr:EcsC family protein [Salibaculum sp.]HKL69818.1 EcsC family protein [Salibaculum sp.]